MKKRVIEFKDVSKTYKLYKNEKYRVISMLLKRKKYKEKQVLKNISFNVDEGESVAFFGKNGAGKSTVLKMITEVSYPTSGKIKVNGSVSALLELTTGFDLEFTGRQNIYLKGNILGLNDEKIKDLEKRIVEFAGLGEYIDQPVRMYSSGMKAKLGFAISVNVDPEILIVDEALSVGDKEFQKKCLNKIRELLKNEKLTLLFVTHSTKTAKDFCKRGIVLDKGHILFDGEIEKAIKVYEEDVK